MPPDGSGASSKMVFRVRFERTAPRPQNACSGQAELPEDKKIFYTMREVLTPNWTPSPRLTTLHKPPCFVVRAFSHFLAIVAPGRCQLFERRHVQREGEALCMPTYTNQRQLESLKNNVQERNCTSLNSGIPLSFGFPRLHEHRGLNRPNPCSLYRPPLSGISYSTNW